MYQYGVNHDKKRILTKQKKGKKMKRLNHFLSGIGKTAFLFATAAACTFGAVSCSDDDGDGDGSSSAGNTESGVIETTTGKKVRVVKAGEYTYSYNSDGTLASYFNGDVTYNATYNPFTLTSHYKGSDWEQDLTYGISLNSKGYISAINATESSKEDGESSTSSGKITFSYNGSGNITQIKSSGKGTIVEDGEKISGSSSATYDFTWTDGKLMKISYSYSGFGEKETETYEFTYGSNAKQNVFCQYVPAFMDNDLLDDFSYIGYIGKGPAMLPTSCKYTYTEDDEKPQSGTVSCTYTLNSDGTVNKFTGFESGTMGYADITSSGSKTAAKSVASKTLKRGMLKGWFLKKSK